jgi:hypothetical protein
MKIKFQLQNQIRFETADDGPICLDQFIQQKPSLEIGKSFFTSRIKGIRRSILESSS